MLVIASAYCFVFSSPFFISYFLTRGTQNASTRQILIRASALSQTLSLGLPSPLALSNTFALLLDLYKCVECKGWWAHTGADGNCSFLSTLLSCGLTPKTCCLKLSHIRNNIETLLLFWGTAKVKKFMKPIHPYIALWMYSFMYYLKGICFISGNFKPVLPLLMEW